MQKVQNDELTKCCENFFETLDGYAETKNKHRSATWPLQVSLALMLFHLTLKDLNNFELEANEIFSLNFR